MSDDGFQVKFETLRSFDQDSLLEMESHMSGDHSMGSLEDVRDLHHTSLMSSEYTPPLLPNNRLLGTKYSLTPSHFFDYNKRNVDMNDSNDSGDSAGKTNGHNEHQSGRSHSGGGPKTWTQEDMDMALDALKNHNMSLTKVSHFNRQKTRFY